MSTTRPTTQLGPAGSRRMLLAMVGIGMISALLIVLTYEWTRPRVERLKAEALQQAIFKVLPGTQRIQVLALGPDGEVFEPGGQDQPVQSAIYAGFDGDDRLVGYAVQAEGQGYADLIKVLYGYDPAEEAIVGFYVLESKETPGLGDKIEKDPRFLANFRALEVRLKADGTLRNQITAVKQGEKENPWEIDGITGATISSRAIGDILGSSTAERVPVLHSEYEQGRAAIGPRQNERNE